MRSWHSSGSCLHGLGPLVVLIREAPLRILEAQRDTVILTERGREVKSATFFIFELGGSGSTNFLEIFWGVGSLFVFSRTVILIGVL